MIDLVRSYIVPAALSLLPPEMDAASARALLLAIGLQESGFERRTQRGGTAHGFWQFEHAGVIAVLAHPRSVGLAHRALAELRYGTIAPYNVQLAIRDNDVLACVFARLLLWTLPIALPGPDQADAAWAQYLQAWRPGKPRLEDWPDHYGRAWELAREARA